ncbi:hypothetical protein [Nakamurella aerolata]|uniref:Uncharacterized protein n=1 Tax=Nakamurella aerolata TaxID=1656892 RepID=A0A849A0V1_9ACTN|nr:hypothetical protein [Nakamurella aerolata]NNG34269.1 hypothetical protein [Nakamurella aerolata]
MRKAILSAATAGVVAIGAGITFSVLPAQAALVTYCDGEASSVTVPGDLAVAKGKSCTLSDATVNGNVRIAADANLLLSNSTVNGNTTVASNGYLSADTVTFTGVVSSNSGFGVDSIASDLQGGYRGKVVTGGTEEGYLLASDGTKVKNIVVTTGIVDLSDSTVAGVVSNTGGDLVDVRNSVINGALTVASTANGSVVCDSEVYGAAAYDGNGSAVQLGTGSVSPCTSSNYFDKDVTISNTKGSVEVNDNIIRGNLSGDGNDPAPTGAGNRVRGEVSGQFADLQPAAAKAQARMALPQRAAEAKAGNAKRAASAEKAAVAAGPAFG